MIIEQTLHGYNKGHGLIASSFLVRPNEDSSLMSVISDWTGFRNESGEDSYMTFYPLSNGEKFAFAKTWYADEMERPGCVWTHTLIIDLKDMDRNFDFRVLEDYFRRPQKNEYGYYLRKIEIVNFEPRNSNLVFRAFDDTSILVLYMLLLCNNKNLCIYMDKEQEAYNELCFYLLQYLPLNMLKWVSLSTGSISRRKLGNDDFSIHFTNNENNISLSNAPWNGKINKENFTIGLLYIFEQSKTEDDTFPSLIRLFKEDIKDEKDKLFAFSMLMKELDTALNEKVGLEQYSKVLSLLEEYFPKPTDGIRLKNNFLSEKISNLYGTEKDYLYEIASLKNDSFLHPLLTKFEERLTRLNREKHFEYIDLMDKIADLEHPNDTACEALLYSINNMNEDDLLRLVNNHWLHLLPLLNNNERFFDSGFWLKLSTKQFNELFLLYSSHDFENFKYLGELLKKVIETNTLIEDVLSSKIIVNVQDAVKIVFDSANDSSKSFISPFLLQACLLKKQEVLIWLENQNSINERIERFFIYKMAPDELCIQETPSRIWGTLLERDNGNKYIDFYLFLYILAHNWHDTMSLEMLKHSFYHIYIELSKSRLSEKNWTKIKKLSSNFYFIEKWDKCKIFAKELIDYLKASDITLGELECFTPYKKINERLVRYWKKC